MNITRNSLKRRR